MTDLYWRVPLFLKKGHIEIKFIIAIISIIAAGISAAVWSVWFMDKQLREEILHQSRLIAPAINLNRVKNLSGTESDLSSPDYLRLKEQLGLIQSADKDFRFIYILGKNKDGNIFFFVDNEPSDSKDYSPPGQIYEDATDALKAVFDSGDEFVEGPLNDEWGVWISTLTPLVDRTSGKVIAVMGMDIDAKDWKIKVFSQAAIPVLMIFIFLIILLMWANKRRIAVKLKENEEKYRRFFDTSLDCTFITSKDGTIIDANDVSLSLFGYSDREDLFKTNIVNLYANAGDREIFIDLLKKKGAAKEYPVVLKKKDGALLHCIVTAVLIKGPDNEITGIQGTVRDISEKKKSEDKINKANEQLSIMVRQLEAQQFRNKQMTEMREFLQACSSTSEIGPIVEQSMKKLFPDSDGALFLLSPSRTDLESIARWGKYPDSMEENIISLDECWGLRRGGLYISNEAEGRILCAHIKKHICSTYACLPLMAKGEVLGLLHLRYGTGQENTKFIEELKDGSSALIELLALAISNIKLREKLSLQSIKDPLTGLFNRRYLEETFLREATRARRKKAEIGVIMVDIDHFKKFNDVFGHAAGDLVLSELAKFFSSGLRGCDIVCRYGGEEFALVLPDANIENTFTRAQQLVEKAREIRVHFSGQALGQITLSMGVSAYPVHGEKLEEILKAADIALYRAKQTGRDRVVMADTAH